MMGEFNLHNFEIDRVKPVSRADLWTSSAVLAVFAIAFGSSLTAAKSPGEFALRGLLTLVFVAGTALFLRSALLWGKPQPVVEPEHQKVRDIRSSFDKARNGGNRKAA